MTYEAFINNFKSHIIALSYKERLSLAISVCEKLFVDYQDFYEENNWGDPGVLLEAIKLCRLSQTDNVEEIHLKEALVKFDRITPDTEDFSNASYALNACVAICGTLEFIMDKEAMHVFNVGVCLTDTIDVGVREEGDLTEEQIDEHPMMIEAREFLLGDYTNKNKVAGIFKRLKQLFRHK